MLTNKRLIRDTEPCMYMFAALGVDLQLPSSAGGTEMPVSLSNVTAVVKV
jgi:hypothetical protein